MNKGHRFNSSVPRVHVPRKFLCHRIHLTGRIHAGERYAESALAIAKDLHSPGNCKSKIRKFWKASQSVHWPTRLFHITGQNKSCRKNARGLHLSTQLARPRTAPKNRDMNERSAFFSLSPLPTRARTTTLVLLSPKTHAYTNTTLKRNAGLSQS